jgi:hypothetical protein
MSPPPVTPDRDCHSISVNSTEAGVVSKLLVRACTLLMLLCFLMQLLLFAPLMLMLFCLY